MFPADSAVTMVAGQHRGLVSCSPPARISVPARWCPSSVVLAACSCSLCLGARGGGRRPQLRRPVAQLQPRRAPATSPSALAPSSPVAICTAIPCHRPMLHATPRSLLLRPALSAAPPPEKTRQEDPPAPRRHSLLLQAPLPQSSCGTRRGAPMSLADGHRS